MEDNPYSSVRLEREFFFGWVPMELMGAILI